MSFNRNKSLAKAQKLLQKGKTKDAIREYEEVVRNDPSDVRTLLKIGDLHAKLNDVSSATSTYQKVGEHYAKDGFFLKAVAVFKQILKLDPGLILIYIKLAELYQNLGLSSDAIKQYQVVARHYESQGLVKDSLDVLQKIAELEPENITNKIKLAELYCREGHKEDGKKQFFSIIEYLEAKRNYPELIRVYEKIVALEFQEDGIELKLVECYLTNAEPKKALIRLQKLFQKNAKNIEVLDLLAQCFVELSQPEKSKSVYLEILNILETENREEEKDKYVAKLRTLNVVAKDADNLEANDLPITPEKSSPQDRQAKIFEELDTFLQYGLYEKAINLLGDAFKSDFNSQDIKMKLFEVAKVCDKQKAFEVLSIVKQTATEQGFTETSSEIDEFMSLHSIEAHEVSPVEETRLESVEVFKDEEDVFEPSYERSLAQVEAVSADQVSPKEDNGHIEFGESGTEDSNFLAGFEMELNEDPQVAESVDFVAHKAQEDHEDDDDDDQYEQPLANPELDDGNKIDEPVLAFNDEVSQDESLEAKKAIESPSPEASSDSFSFDLDMPVPEQDSNLSEQDSFVDFSIDVVDESASEPSIAVPVIEEIIEEPRISQEFPVERSIEDLMKDANQFIEKREFTNARDVLVNVLIKDRSYIPAIEALSKCSSSKAEVSNAAPLDVQPSPQPLNNGPQSASDLFDLSVELKDEIDDLEQQFAKPGNPDDNYLSPEEVISEFKKGVARTVAKDDYQTHYNLGIAYKEMGLLDEAIAEFETAMESEELKVSCVSMIGLCLTGKRDFSQAITLYKKILSELPAVKSPQVLGLSYELAESFIGAGYVGEAYKLFSKVCEFDPGFRDIKVRVKELEAEFGDQDSSKVSSIDKLSKKNKVSYI